MLTQRVATICRPVPEPMPCSGSDVLALAHECKQGPLGRVLHPERGNPTFGVAPFCKVNVNLIKKPLVSFT